MLEFKSWYDEIQRDTKRVELKAANEVAPVADVAVEAVVSVPVETVYTTILDQATFDLWLKTQRRQAVCLRYRNHRDRRPAGSIGWGFVRGAAS